MTALHREPETVLHCEDAATGLRGVIVVHDTTLGPALGGIRMRSYPTPEAAEAECRRLAFGMTRKNALADIAFGGGKSVIDADAPVDREGLLRAFAKFVAELDGAYIPAVDIGTSPADLRIVGEVAEVSCDDADPSPATARGVYAAIETAIRVVLDRSLRRTRVVVQGVGHVGSDLARQLVEAGAEVLVADIDRERAEAVAAALGAEAIDPATVTEVECDVFAPCAAARVIDDESVGRLGCRIVAGAANDVLASPYHADELRGRGIAYVPDFVASAGGVIHVRALRDGWSEELLERELLRIGERSEEVLKTAEKTGQTTVAVAEGMVERKLEAARRGVPG
jgi:leucine dehydrogenase